VLLLLFLILSSLALSLYYLIKDEGKTKRTVKALTVRIILSLILFLALLMAFALGWITPHGVQGVTHLTFFLPKGSDSRDLAYDKISF